MNRTVTLPGGKQYKNVPPNVTDEDVLRMHLARQAEEIEQPALLVSQEEIEKNTVPDPSIQEEQEDGSTMSAFGSDVAKMFLRTGQGAATFAADSVNVVGRMLGSEEDIIPEYAVKQAPASLVGSIPIIGDDIVANFIEEDFSIKQPETIGGMAAEVVPYVIGGGAIYKSSALSKAPKIIKGALSGATIDQVLYTADDENLVDVLDDAELIQAEGIFRDVADFLVSNEDDTVLEKRMKYLIDGAIVGGTIGAIFTTPQLAASAARMYKKKVHNLTDEELSDVSMSVLKDARAAAKYKESDGTELSFTETAESLAQIEQQNSSLLKRFKQQFFTSRGYLTPAAFSAFNESQYAQRQLVKQAENISQRLQQRINKLGDEATTENASRNVEKALTDPFFGLTVKVKTAQPISDEQKIRLLIKNYSLTPEVAETVLEARKLIDDLSTTLANSSIPQDNELRQTILGNVGEYMRRSYRLFEDVGYVPSQNAVDKAIRYLEGTGLSAEQARGQVDAILKQAGNAKNVNEYFSYLGTLNKKILTEKKEIPQEIRELMGEIESPSENIILTVSKLAQLTETNKFYSNIKALGESPNHRYIFDEERTLDNGTQFTTMIQGTGSELDGKFTTPEIAAGILRKEWDADFKSQGLGRIGNYFGATKSFSQKMKTVWSHVTHLRNVMGGFQFGIANGINPFAIINGDAAETLWYQARNLDDKTVTDKYEEYLKYGVINTNVRVNEMRRLLDAGMDSKGARFVDKLEEYVPGYGFAKAADKIGTEVYMAVDDFYKINAFEFELKNLQKAFPDQNIDVLKEEAARKVRQTFPNYDRVTKGIKALRYLPMGNFVSFPTEIWRTTVNIVQEASKEITSGNEVLAQRGLTRLAGLVTQGSVFAAGGAATAQMAGLGPEEEAAIQEISKTPWSNAPRLVTRIDGELYTVDTQFIDSYSTIKQPILEAYNEIRSGELRGQALTDYLGKAVGAAALNSLEPYIGEAMVTEAGLDTLFAATSESGRTRTGKQLFPEEMDTPERMLVGFQHVANAFVPGTAKSFYDVLTAETPQDLKSEFYVNITGLRFSKVDPAETLKYASLEYKRRKGNITSSMPEQGDSPEAMFNAHVERQKALYELQQEYYGKYAAAKILLSDKEIDGILKRAAITKSDRRQFAVGRFSPENYNATYRSDLLRDMGVTARDLYIHEQSIMDANRNMSKTPLMYVEPKEIEEGFEVERLPYAKGGEVIVPNAPVEPDERIDKMTGLPYNIQAGSAFVDEEDPEKRMLFNLGGIVSKALGISEDDIAWAKSMSKKYPEAEELDGRGDAARHLALGWLAKQSNYPSFSKFAANAREFVEFDFKGGSMDIENNNKGFNMKAATREEAEEEIQKMIRNKEVLYYTPEESQSRRGYQVGGSVEDPSMYRSDGSKKSAQGFLGPVKNNVEGGTMTEVSVGMEINGQEMEVPTMVPSLTKEEIETLANMKLEGNAKNIPESIIMKAKQHALQRIEQGLSPFYQDGEK